MSPVEHGCWQIAADADWIRAFVTDRGAWANIPPKCNRKDPICLSPYLYRDRNLIERFFNKIKQCRPRPDTTSLPLTISPSSSSSAFAYGCAFMSARPSEPNHVADDALRPRWIHSTIELCTKCGSSSWTSLPSVEIEISVLAIWVGAPWVPRPWLAARLSLDQHPTA